MSQRSQPSDPRWNRLIHLVAGELPADEAAELRAWVDADPERRQALARLEGVWHATAPSGHTRPDAWDAEAELRRIYRETGRGSTGRVIARVGSTFDLRGIGVRRPRFDVVLRVAAVLLLMVGGSLLWRLGTPTPSARPAPPVAATEYRTAPGERLSFGLSDGTRVMLAPGSVLRRSADYGVRDRVVQLEGEGYFYVTHDPTRPFAVHTARAVARDLGTRFVVRAYPNDTTSDIAVAEGLVAVTRAASRKAGGRPSADSLLLRPGQRASVGDDGPLVLANDGTLDRYFRWTAGELVFERTPLDDVVLQLERWYGIEIELRILVSSRNDYRLTATLHEEGATEALDLVATSLDLTVSRVGRTYVLDRRGR